MMTVMMGFITSYDYAVSNAEFHEIIRVASEVDCFVRFYPPNTDEGDFVKMARSFRKFVDCGKDIIFTLSSNPYDHASQYLFEREIVDEEGYTSDYNIPNLARVLGTFLKGISKAKEYTFLCSEGYVPPDDFAVLNAPATEFTENFTAIYLGRDLYLPDVVIHGHLQPLRS